MAVLSLWLSGAVAVLSLVGVNMLLLPGHEVELFCLVIGIVGSRA